jgi:16S rRNA G966 N2-methylase RsmD
MDPPYADPQIEHTIASVAAMKVGHPGSLLIVGHSPRVTLADSYPLLTRVKFRRLGDSCFSIYELGDGSAPTGAGEPEGSPADAQHQ